MNKWRMLVRTSKLFSKGTWVNFFLKYLLNLVVTTPQKIRREWQHGIKALYLAVKIVT